MDGRDRTADFLRASSMLLIVVGHTLQLLEPHLAPLIPWETWIAAALQVIPIFFVVGGLVNAGSWERARARGESWASWLQRRAQRLFTPLVPLLAAWIVVVPLLLAARYPRGFVQVASEMAFVPVWFLAAYLAVVALVPLTWALHRRFGLRALVGFVVGAALVDLVARRAWPVAGDVNILLVWGGLHQLGYFGRGARVPRPVAGAAMLVGGVLALVLLVGVAGYPSSMIALAPDTANNASPPTLALFALGAVQVGGVLLVRPVLERALARRGPERAVRLAGSVSLTVYLWHMSALLSVGFAAFALGRWPEAPDFARADWLASPAGLLAALAVLAIVVLALRPIERIPLQESRDASTLLVAAGLAATLAGITLLGQMGLYPSDAPWLFAAGAAALVFAGLAAMGVLAPARWRTLGQKG